MTMRRLCAVVLFTAPLPSLAAQAPSAIPVQAGAMIDRDSVTVGDVVTLVLRVRTVAGATINFPVAADSQGAVQAIAPPVVRNGTDSATATDRVATYRLSPWNVGLLPISLGDVVVQTDAGERRFTPPLPKLFVRSVLPADTALRVPKPLRPLMDLPAATAWWIWLVAVLVALALGIAAWWWWRQRGASASATVDPYAWAQEEFARIDALRLVEAGEAGRHAALTADVARRYLTLRLAQASLAQTSTELMRALRGAPTVPHDALSTLLASVDEVKFAAAPVNAERARAIGTEARAIVDAEHERARAAAAALPALADERAA